MNLWTRIQMFLHMKTEAALDGAEDPRETLEYAYHRQRELLSRVKQGLVEVATSRRQLELQAHKLRARVPQCEDQTRRALAAGREDLARAALQRKQTCLAELAQLDRQLADVSEEERKLALAEQQCAQRLDAFRARRDTLAARYTAAEAQVKVNEAAGSLSSESAELGAALERAEAKIEHMQARASALDALLLENGALVVSGDDAIDRELRDLAARQSVEDELAALKTQLQAGA
jgi:phage shock protein A